MIEQPDGTFLAIQWLRQVVEGLGSEDKACEFNAPLIVAEIDRLEKERDRLRADLDLARNERDTQQAGRLRAEGERDSYRRKFIDALNGIAEHPCPNMKPATVADLTGDGSRREFHIDETPTQENSDE